MLSMDIFKRILLKGDIPYFKNIKSHLVYLSFFSLLIFIFPGEFKFFWEIWWKMLLIIIFSRPLRDIFPKIWIFKKIVLLRKELWIICGFFVLAHFVWYLIIFKISIVDFIISDIRGLKSAPFWWLLSTIALIPLLITSNIFSMKKLWKWWKKVQQLTYFFFIFWALHIAFVNPEKEVAMIIVSSAIASVWVLAKNKVVLWK